MVVVSAILLTVAATFMGGSARLIQMREAMVTGAVGLLFIVTLGMKRPMIFDLARAMVARSTEGGVEAYEQGVGGAGRAPGVPRAHCGLGIGAVGADQRHVLARLDLADRAVSAPLAVHFPLAFSAC